MLDKCKECYEDNKTPDNSDCLKCDENYKRLEFELKVTKADYEASEEENKELKEMLSKEPKAMQAFQIAYRGLKKENEVLWGMVKDYKTALEEIKKVIKSYDLTVDNGASVDTLYTIRKIINEVLNDSEC